MLTSLGVSLFNVIRRSIPMPFAGGDAEPPTSHLSSIPWASLEAVQFSE
jgi:hypothetical protein